MRYYFIKNFQILPLFPTFFQVTALTRVVIGFYSIIEVGFYLDNAEFSALNCSIVEIRG